MSDVARARAALESAVEARLHELSALRRTVDDATEAMWASALTAHAEGVAVTDICKMILVSRPTFYARLEPDA